MTDAKKQSELHPDDDVDISGMGLACGRCGSSLVRGHREEFGLEEQKYSLYPYRCASGSCETQVDLFIPLSPNGGGPKPLTAVTLSTLEIKSQGYLEPIDRQVDATGTTFHFARRGEAGEIVVSLTVPS